jgi:hypothetical protein
LSSDSYAIKFKKTVCFYRKRLTKFLNGEALNEAFENKQHRIKLRKSYHLFSSDLLQIAAAFACFVEVL